MALSHKARRQAADSGVTDEVPAAQGHRTRPRGHPHAFRAI
jgi:hypothetical protein